MDMLAIKNRMEKESSTHSILIYGDSGVGKTRMAATAALIPQINRIVWIDLENGKDTILHMGLPDEALAKIELFSMVDSRKEPFVMNAMLKMFQSKTDVPICENHGKMSCLSCTQEKAPFQNFNLTKLTPNDLVVVDTGTQLTDCGVNALLKGQPEDAILQIQEWGTVNNWLKSILQVVQAGRYTNFIVLCHVLYDQQYHGTGPNKELVKTKLYPNMGTKTFSGLVGKYFGTVVFLEIKGNKHTGGSSSTYKVNCTSKSRIGAQVEKSTELNMKDILIKGGIIR